LKNGGGVNQRLNDIAGHMSILNLFPTHFKLGAQILCRLAAVPRTALGGPLMLDEPQERLIAQGLREGKADAWQALYDAYAERVWRGVARLLGPRSSDVADVVQETMMAAARSASTFDPARGSLWPWLWGIAHNHVALHLRKQEQRDRLAQAAASNGKALRWLDGAEHAPLDALAVAELATLVRGALAELPADYALLLTARYLDGETVAQIAQREHASEVAIRSKLARARQAFREAFAKWVVRS
jgi:RNA polymerase sigma-70 factor, ECF subfamily